jgi:hypothetical protein
MKHCPLFESAAVQEVLICTPILTKLTDFLYYLISAVRQGQLLLSRLDLWRKLAVGRLGLKLSSARMLYQHSPICRFTTIIVQFLLCLHCFVDFVSCTLNVAVNSSLSERIYVCGLTACPLLWFSWKKSLSCCFASVVKTPQNIHNSVWTLDATVVIRVRNPTG